MKVTLDKYGVYRNSTKSYSHYTASNKVFSYKWCFAKEFITESNQRVMVFNEHKISPTTSKHQSYYKSNELRYYKKPVLYIDVPDCSLDDADWIYKALEYYNNADLINDLIIFDFLNTLKAGDKA